MPNPNLKELARLFLQLGLISFGGPAAHTAMMEKEVVKKRGWMSHEHFLDLLGATNLIPGPNATEMTMHIGMERAGWKGLALAGLCFILPAAIITAGFAWAYQRYGQLPEVAPFIFGIKPAVIAIVVSALVSLGKKALKNTELIVLAILTLGASLLGVNEIAALFGCGLAGLIFYFLKNKFKSANSIIPFVLLFSAPKITQLGIFLVFLKIGALLYGSGYVLFAFLDAELVAKGLLTRQQLIDAVAVGQFTPGPVLSTATFIGWQLKGPWGALLATAGVFLPSFFFVALLNPLIPRMRRSKIMAAFLDAVNAASIAVIASVCLEMGRDTLTDWRTVVIAALGVAVVFGLKKLNSAFVVLGGAALGYLLWWVG